MNRLLTPSFFALTAAHFLQALGYASMLLLPLYLKALGASHTKIGAVMAAASLSGLLARPVVGLALDRFGRKPTLVVGTFILAASMGSFTFVTELGPLVYVARLWVGVGTGALFSGYFALAADIVPFERRTQGLALFGISGVIPLVVSPVATGLGVTGSELGTLFLVLGGVILCSLIPLSMVREPQKDLKRSTESKTLVAVLNRSLWSTWLATFVFAAMIALFMAFAAVSAQKRNIPYPTLLWLSYVGAVVLVRLFMGQGPDRVGPSRLVGPCFVLYCLAAVVASTAESTLGLLVLGALAGMGHGISFPMLASVVTLRVPEAHRGSGFAMLTALFELGNLVMTPVFGWIADLSSDERMFEVAAAGTFFAAGAWWVLERRAPKKAPTPLC